jgi:hypothetical protein
VVKRRVVGQGVNLAPSGQDRLEGRRMRAVSLVVPKNRRNTRYQFVNTQVSLAQFVFQVIRMSFRGAQSGFERRRAP